jgi:hypothetical protein
MHTLTVEVALNGQYLVDWKAVVLDHEALFTIEGTRI